MRWPSCANAPQWSGDWPPARRRAAAAREREASSGGRGRASTGSRTRDDEVMALVEQALAHPVFSLESCGVVFITWVAGHDGAVPGRDNADACPRLARRLQRPGPPIAAEILPLIRSELVARGYQAVAESAELAAIPAAAWRAHGFRRSGGEWQAEPWLPRWLDDTGRHRTRRQPAGRPAGPTGSWPRTAFTPTPRSGATT